MEKHLQVLLNVSESAKLLDISVNTMRQWLSQGRFPRVKVGRLTKLKAEDLQAYIEAHTVPANQVARDL